MKFPLNVDSTSYQIKPNESIIYQLFVFLNFFKSTPRSGRNLEKTVLVKKFPRFEDPFCLGKQEKARSLRLNDDDGSLNDGITSQDEVSGRDAVVKSFADPNTPKVNIYNILHNDHV